MNVEYKGILEIDYTRGVIYFHDSSTGQSMLRICGLKLGNVYEEVDFIDITKPENISVIKHSKR
jgi:hypothetical protein